jgi:hypothetical protein
MIDLAKRKSQVNLTKSKRGIPKGFVAKVGELLDVSGSASPMYKDGKNGEESYFQVVISNTSVIGLEFDDNQTLDMYTFCDENEEGELTPVTEHNIMGYVQKEIVNNSAIEKWGGTYVCGAIEKMLEKHGFYERRSYFFGLFKSKKKKLLKVAKDGIPSVNYILTDGHFGDGKKVKNLIQELATVGTKMFFVIIGIGNNVDQNYLAEIARFPNTHSICVPNDESWFKRDEVYDDLIPQKLYDYLK